APRPSRIRAFHPTEIPNPKPRIKFPLPSGERVRVRGLRRRVLRHAAKSEGPLAEYSTEVKSIAQLNLRRPKKCLRRHTALFLHQECFFPIILNSSVRLRKSSCVC